MNYDITEKKTETSRYSVDDYLRDSFERARNDNESYGVALMLNLAIIKPYLYKKLRLNSDDLRGYNPGKWNYFLKFLSNNWYLNQ